MPVKSPSRPSRTKARTKLGWTPRVTFKELVHLMVDADMEGGGRPVHPRG